MMGRMKTSLALVFTFFLIAGCSSDGQKAGPDGSALDGGADTSSSHFEAGHDSDSLNDGRPSESGIQNSGGDGGPLGDAQGDDVGCYYMGAPATPAHAAIEGSSCDDTRDGGTGFSAGSCHQGTCCLGCWDGTACHSGKELHFCGHQGGPCAEGNQPGGACGDQQ